MDDKGTTVPVERTGPAPLARIGLVGAAAAAIVAVAILAAGATASPTGTLAAGADAAVTTLAGEVLPIGSLGREFERVRGFGRMHGPGGITISGISGSDISLGTTDGWTRTITVDGGTTYTDSGDAIALSDLAVGDEIRFAQTLEDDGTWSIDAVAVILPHLGGTVTAISGSAITVERPDGTAGTVNVTASTTYSVGGDDSSALADVKVGMVLRAEGTRNGDGSLTASAVRALDPDTLPGPGGMPGRGGHGMHGPWSDFGGDAVPDATTTPGVTSDSAG